MNAHTRGPSEEQWRSDRIEPTFELDGTYGWLLDDRIVVETELAYPVVGWAEWNGDRLATFHYPPSFRLFKLEPDGGQSGRLRAIELVSRSDPQFMSKLLRELPVVSAPWTGRRALSAQAQIRIPPVLAAVMAEQEALIQRQVEEDAARRAADPLIGVLEELEDLAMDVVAAEHWAGDAAVEQAGRAKLTEAIQALDDAVAKELLARVILQKAYSDYDRYDDEDEYD